MDALARDETPNPAPETARRQCVRTLDTLYERLTRPDEAEAVHLYKEIAFELRQHLVQAARYDPDAEPACNALQEALNEVMAAAGEGRTVAQAAPNSVPTLAQCLHETLQSATTEMLRQREQLNSLEGQHDDNPESRAQMLQIRRMARHAITSGIAANEVEQRGWFRDALTLLSKAVANPAGSPDPLTWFQVGWLLWKSEDRLVDALVAFERAARFSRRSGSIVEVLALRHAAYMNYLLQQYAEAYEECRAAAIISPTHDTVLELSRYAALTERAEESLELFEQCVTARPTTFYAALADADFDCIATELAEERSHIGEQAAQRAGEAVQKWQRVLATVQTRSTQSGVEIVLPEDVAPDMETWEQSRQAAGFVQLGFIERHAHACHDRAFEAAEEYLRQEEQARLDASATLSNRAKETRETTRLAIRAADQRLNRSLNTAEQVFRDSTHPQMGSSTLIALATSVLAVFTGQSVEVGFVVFVPALMMAMTIGWLMNYSSGLAQYTAAVKAAKARHAATCTKIRKEMDSTLQELNASAQRMDTELLKIEHALAMIRAREYA